MTANTDWVAWGIVDFAGRSFPEFITFAAAIEVFICGRMITTLIAVTCGWTITVIAHIVSMAIHITSTHRMTGAIISIAIISMVSFLTLAISHKVTLRVVVTGNTVLTRWAYTTVPVVTNWMTGFQV